MGLFGFGKKKTEPAPAPAPEPVVKETVYDFIVKSENENTTKAIAAYQKDCTDADDRYEGMRLMEFKKEGSPGDKVYEFPPLKVSVKLEAFIGEDGTTEISGFILDGDDEIYVGKAAKTKAKKILRILQENEPKITGELYGGKYWKMEDSGYVNNDWSEVLTVRVYLTY